MTSPIRLEADQIYHLACPASQFHLPVQPRQNCQNKRDGDNEYVGAG